MNYIKRLIPLKSKRYILDMRKSFQKHQKHIKLRYYLNSIKNERKMLFLDAADYGNLGDQAILMAEEAFLKDNFSDYKFLRVGLGSIIDSLNMIKNFVSPEDIIILQGGGNFGNEYKRAEKVRGLIIETFPQNQIIIFPQTIYFSNDDAGRYELQKSINIYSKHEKLVLIAREKMSYTIMKEKFKNNKILLTPDIVLYLNNSLIKEVRQGVLYCFRNDIEGLLTQNEKEHIMAFLNKSYTNVSITDTIGENNFNSVENKLQEFKKAELVITDRLHGMIFAAITGTPCIALSNYNYKVSGTYEWIKHLNYVKYAETIQQIPDLMTELRGLKDTNYDNSFAKDYYNLIIEEIRENINKQNKKINI